MTTLTRNVRPIEQLRKLFPGETWTYDIESGSWKSSNNREVIGFSHLLCPSPGSEESDWHVIVYQEGYSGPELFRSEPRKFQ